MIHGGRGSIGQLPISHTIDGDHQMQVVWINNIFESTWRMEVVATSEAGRIK